MKKRGLWKKIRECGTFILFVLAMIPVGLVLLLCGLAARGACAVLERRDTSPV